MASRQDISEIKSVLFVGGARVGVEFLNILYEAHQASVCNLIGAVPGHLAEKVDPKIEPFARDRNIPVCANLAGFPAPDLIISAGNHIIFTAETLAKSRVINLHAAPLPEYAGSACMAWAILNCERTFGLTFHYPTEKLDRGEFIFKRTFPIDDEITSGELDKLVTQIAVSTFRQQLSTFLRLLPGTPLPPASRPPYSRSELEPHREIDLSWPQERIWRHVRAFDCEGILKPAFVRIAGREVYLTARYVRPFISAAGGFAAKEAVQQCANDATDEGRSEAAPGDHKTSAKM
jgi:Methionyl-tRNA formyltransferase